MSISDLKIKLEKALLIFDIIFKAHSDIIFKLHDIDITVIK